MTLLFRSEMFLIAILFFCFVIKAINRNVFVLKNAAVWLVSSAVAILLSLFPSILYSFTRLLGFKEPSNFLYFCAILFLAIYAIQNSIISSTQQRQITKLVQELSILKSKNKEHK